MRKYILLYTGLLLSVSGCSLLELDESTGLDREEAYSYFSNVKGLATYVYSQLPRSEERRVGKECRSRWSPYH